MGWGRGFEAFDEGGGAIGGGEREVVVDCEGGEVLHALYEVGVGYDVKLIQFESEIPKSLLREFTTDFSIDLIDSVLPIPTLHIIAIRAEVLCGKRSSIEDIGFLSSFVVTDF